MKRTTLYHSLIAVIVLSASGPVHSECASCVKLSASHQDDLNNAGYYEDTNHFNSNIRGAADSWSIEDHSEQIVPNQEQDDIPPKKIRQKCSKALKDCTAEPKKREKKYKSARNLPKKSQQEDQQTSALQVDPSKTESSQSDNS